MFEKEQYSLLVVSSVDQQFNDTINLMKKFTNRPFIYVSVNRTEEKIKRLLKQRKINTKNIFFIDCFSSKSSEKSICVDPSKLDTLLSAIIKFLESVKGDKIVIIDGLTALAIYNSENKVAKFIKKLIETVSKRKEKLIVFTQKTNEDLLGMVYNFFDKVMD